MSIGLRNTKAWWLSAAAGIVLIGTLHFFDASEARDHEPLMSAALPPLTGLTDAETVVQQQFRERHQFLKTVLNDVELPGASHALAFGQWGEINHAYLRVEPARDAYLKAIQLNPGHYRWPYLLSQLERMDGQAERAIELLQQTLDLAPNFTAAMLWLGDLHRELDQPLIAHTYYDQVLTAIPSSARAMHGKALVALASGKFAQAEGLLLTALKSQPMAYPLNFSLAELYRNWGKTGKAALFLNRLPSNRFGMVALQENDPVMQSVVDLRRNSDVLLHKARKAQVQGYPLRAEALFSQAVKQRPDRVDAHQNHAEILLDLRQYDAARRALDRALALDPDNPYARLTLARIERRSARFKLAHGIAEKLIDDSQIGLEARQLVARICIDMEHMECAGEQYAALRQLGEDVHDAWIGSALIELRHGNLEKAIATIRKKLTTQPHNNRTELLLVRLLALQDAQDPEIPLLLSAKMDVRQTAYELQTRAIVAAATERWAKAEHLQRQTLSASSPSKLTALRKRRLTKIQSHTAVTDLSFDEELVGRY